MACEPTCSVMLPVKASWLLAVGQQVGVGAAVEFANPVCCIGVLALPSCCLIAVLGCEALYRKPRLSPLGGLLPLRAARAGIAAVVGDASI